MRKIATAALALSFSISAPLSAETLEYRCQAEKQLIVSSQDREWSYSAGDVDEQNRTTFQFSLRIKKGENGALSMTRESGGVLDVLGFSTTGAVMTIAPGQIAILASAHDNCLFTEQACGAILEMSDSGANDAQFSLLPIGSVKQEDGARDILHFIALGSCTKQEIS